ncbi:MAG: maleylacetoacetate isomerase [Betaproteobacteria bacterium]|nr:MAG: maleylacetoacetate isomerase [Betaproteobacteria bacterium]
MRLYTFFRGSSPFRVRIALNLKGLAYDPVFVHLGRGEQASPEYRAVNPQGLVPTLEDDGIRLPQSLAIIEYLEEKYPQPPLLPRDPAGRARVRALSLVVACEIHPLNNPRVLKYLRARMGQGEEAVNAWYGHWIAEGLAVLEAEALRGAARFSHGDSPTMADCCLVPQIFNARRYACDLAPYPRLLRIFDACMELEAFQRAQPSRQPDAET